MFRKPFHVKSNTNIRGSDRRHLKSRVADRFPDLTADQISEMLPNKGTVTVMKLTTHADHDCLVYLLESQPLFFEESERLYPTVYALWQYPNMIPSLTTWPPVFGKLSNGADLMLPGVDVSPSSGLPEMLRNRPCAVNITGNMAALAIGRTTMSSIDMVNAGMKGKGLTVVHCFRDHLWEIGDKSNPPVIPMNVGEDTQDIAPCDNVGDCKEEEEEANGLDVNSLSIQREVNGKEEDDIYTLLRTNNECTEDDDDEEDEELSPVEKMDALCYQCLLHCLKSKVKQSDLPMTTINLYRTHMRSVCPPDMTLDVKKSSFKKLGKFLAFAENKGLLEVKETSRGVDSLISFDKRHDDLAEFQIPENVFSEPDVVDNKFQVPVVVKDDSTGAWQGSLQQMYSVTASMVPVLKTMGYSKGTWMKPEEVRAVITEYVKLNELVDPLKRSMVTLAPLLHDAIMDKSEGYITHIPWDQLFARCFAKMSSGYRMLPTSETSSGRPVIKGKLKPICMKIERKAGNKLMTVIQNLVPFGIDVKEFAHKLQIGVAASATISQGQGQKSGVEVRVQGNQVKYLSKLLLDEYKIPRKYVQGLDLAPKGKKR